MAKEDLKSIKKQASFDVFEELQKYDDLIELIAGADHIYPTELKEFAPIYAPMPCVQFKVTTVNFDDSHENGAEFVNIRVEFYTYQWAANQTPGSSLLGDEHNVPLYDITGSILVCLYKNETLTGKGYNHMRPLGISDALPIYVRSSSEPTEPAQVIVSETLTYLLRRRIRTIQV